MKSKIYVETSVISYLTSRPSSNAVNMAHQQITKSWWNKRSKYELYISELVVKECSVGNPDAVNGRLTTLAEIGLLHTPNEAVDLVKELLIRKIMPRNASEDALHIVIATLHSIDFLLTWNCKHIANPQIQQQIAAYFAEYALSLPFICTPEELLRN